MKPLSSPKVSKYKKKLGHDFDAPASKSLESNTDEQALKKWTVSRDNASIAINFITEDECHGFPYTYLQRWRFTLKGEIHLKYSEGLVIIKGSDLLPLYHDICRYRLIEVTLDEFSNGTTVDNINVKLNDEALK